MSNPPAIGFLAATLILAPATLAAADVHTVLDPEQRIITRNEFMFDLFNPTELVLTPYVPGGGPFSQSPNSMRISFRDLGGAPLGLITGNILPIAPPKPYATPSLLDATDPLLQEGTWLDSSRAWRDPWEAEDIVDPAHYSQAGSHGDFDLLSFESGATVLIGYATSDKSMFGYVQIERVTTYDWKLIGYRFDDSGAPLFMQNLIPAPGALALLGLALAAPRHSRRSRPTPVRHHELKEGSR